MKDIVCFTQNVRDKFENSYDNMLQFEEVCMNAMNRVSDKYDVAEGNKIIRNQFDNILGIDFKNATSMQRRQAWRDHGKEIASLIETEVADKMNSGWTTANAKFMDLVEEINLAEDDKNEFFVNDNSLLQVSKFAGDHHDILRQAVHPGKSFSIDTSFYGIKVYTDFKLFQLGKVDFAEMINRMYTSIEQYRLGALYTATMSMDQSLPTDMILATPVTESTRDAIIEHIESVIAATGRNVILIGARSALQKLQNTVNYNMWSDSMKDERHNNGILGNWEGFDCVPLERVNKVGTRESVFTDEDLKKIYIFPVDPEFKPIKRVNSGDVVYYESGMDGSKKDMTIDAEISYEEGIGVVINQLFGEIKIAG